VIALCLGGAERVWCDLEALARLAKVDAAPHEHGKPCVKHGRTRHKIPTDWPGPVIAANDIAVHWPHQLDHLVSLHAEKIQRWRRARTKAGYPDGYLVWLTENSKLSDRLLPFRHKGSSGMYAPRVAKEVGATGSVLCGVPLTISQHFRESGEHKIGMRWPHAEKYWEVWQACEKELRAWNVKSMSGRTRQLLGAPDREWLNTHMAQGAAA
jgi:hypothetical protein